MTSQDLLVTMLEKGEILEVFTCQEFLQETVNFFFLVSVGEMETIAGFHLSRILTRTVNMFLFGDRVGEGKLLLVFTFQELLVVNLFL